MHVAIHRCEQPKRSRSARNDRRRIERRQGTLRSNSRRKRSGEIILGRSEESAQGKLLACQWPRIVALPASYSKWQPACTLTESARQVGIEEAIFARREPPYTVCLRVSTP